VNIWWEASGRGFEKSVLTVTGTGRGSPKKHPPSGQGMQFDVQSENNLNKKFRMLPLYQPD
jgi:hypothetical protein